MASSYANMPKSSQYSQRKFAESSPKTLVGLHKTDVQLKKMMESLDRQQNTAVNNLANHQQAMKMSWRRLEERRSTSPLMTRHEKKHKEEANARRGLLLQSNTRLYVRGTPQVYDVDQAPNDTTQRPFTADDSILSRAPPPPKAYLIHNKSASGPGPVPMQVSRAQTSPYITSPYNFRKSAAAKDVKERASSLDEAQLNSSQSQEELKSSSQPMLIKTSAINNKETLLKASDFMGIKSSSSGPGGFKNFYSDRPRSLTHGTLPLSPLVSKVEVPDDEGELNEDESSEGDVEVEASSSMPSLADQFEQIKNCRYIRHSPHYHPEAAAFDSDN